MCCVVSMRQEGAFIVPAADRATLKPTLKVLGLSGDAAPDRDVECRANAHSAVDLRGA